MFDVALYQPEIPPNTGNVIRLCAVTGCRLHLVQPLGFRLEDRRLKRAGLDYHEYASVQVHAGLAALFASLPNARAYAFTTKGSGRYDEVNYREGDLLLFGPETRGLPEEVLATFEPQQRLRLPMLANRRSLNLSSSVAVVVYEGLRQNGFEGLS